VELDVIKEVGVISEALDRLAGLDPSALADPEVVIALSGLAARSEAITTQATAAFDASGEWAPDGARNASAWITTTCRLKKSEAKRQVRRGRELRCLPETERAWVAGDITGDHVDVLVSLRCPETEAALIRDEAMLVDQARSLTFAQFSQAVAYWRQLADPDGADQDAEKQRARRDVYLAKSFGGTWLGQTTLDPVSGAIVSDELERLEAELFEADRAEAKEILGRDPGPGDRLSRTPGQRRADALVEMAVRSKSCPGNARRPAPLFTVLVGYETLHGRICELEDGTVVPPGSLLPWLEGADLQRATFSPGHKVAIGCTTRLSTGVNRRVTAADVERATFGPACRVEISPTDRLFTGATRRAIEVRDRRCTHPYCDVTAPFCQVDHIQPWALGGPTTQENGRLLCPGHNGQRNQRPPPAAA
jgi:Domain of unknown function (DUF222)/HNH endonuclease